MPADLGRVVDEEVAVVVFAVEPAQFGLEVRTDLPPCRMISSHRSSIA
ncbi:hypothetical protein ACIHCV_39420 [Streptomyces sp. NPDC051956]